MSQRTVAIAGGGIGGLATAALLARAGERVVVYDRMETPAPIGSGLILQPVGLAVLDEIGAGDRLRALGAPIRRLFGRTEPSGRVVLDVHYRALGAKAEQGLGIHRGALFQALWDAALAAGVEMAGGHDIVSADDGRLTFAHGAISARHDLVIDALGVRTPLSGEKSPTLLPFGALWANLAWPGAPFDDGALEQRYRAARQMVGVLPIGRLQPEAPPQAAFFWSLRRADMNLWRTSGLEAWKAEVHRLWPQTAPLLDQIAGHEQMIAATYAHRTLRSPVSNGVARVGDSWHCASPQLGQGANMALLDALALARALETHADVSQALHAYARARLMHIRLYQLASWMFTPAYQSEGRVVAWVRDWLMSPLSRVWPAPQLLAALVAGRIASPLTAIAAIGDG